VNPRHAAALALVGWYLMIPPKLGVNSKDQIYVESAPFSRWQMSESFDTAKECQEAARALARPEQSAAEAGQRPSLESFRLVYAKCIATDDPRLKEK
jgi:hypothetical protein